MQQKQNVNKLIQKIASHRKNIYRSRYIKIVQLFYTGIYVLLLHAEYMKSKKKEEGKKPKDKPHNNNIIQKDGHSDLLSSQYSIQFSIKSTSQITAIQSGRWVRCNSRNQQKKKKITYFFVFIWNYFCVRTRKQHGKSINNAILKDQYRFAKTL